MGIRIIRQRAHRATIGSLLLVVFALRALIPQGFMPSAQSPLVLQICPDGFPVHLLAVAADPHAAHRHHDGHAMHGQESAGGVQASGTPTHHHKSAASEHCIFGAGMASVGPPSQSISAPGPLAAAPPPQILTTVPVFAPQRFRTPQPRAPPLLA